MKPGLDASTVNVAPSLDDTYGAPMLRAGDATGSPRAIVGLPARYEDLGVIAAGSFGEVRRVRDTRFDRVLAMKLLHVQHVDSEPLRQRFLAEALLTAQLQHPAIVALYEQGELPDGRLWFTMKEVRGRTLRAVIDELHAASGPAGFGVTASGWTLRRLLDAFARIAQAVAYAHSRGVIHRDIKPDNLMVGELGEIQVMDWGLARRVHSAEPPRRDAERDDDRAPSRSMTRWGDVLGTPSYMPPEQARGDVAHHGPWSDVYALGAVLYHLLSGCPPYSDDGVDILEHLLAGPPAPVATASRSRAPVPPELVEICERAMSRTIEGRSPSAERLAEDVLAWLDGMRRRERALEQLARARALEPEASAARDRADRASSRARALQTDLRPYDLIDKKRPSWDLEDEAAREVRAAVLAETRWLQAIQGALSLEPDLLEAHEMLGEHYRARLLEAERAHREDDAARFEVLLRAHDRGQHAGFLRGEGALTLRTDPPGAEVIAHRYVRRDRRLVPERHAHLGETPILAAALPRGSYLLTIRAPGRTEVRYPVLIERGEHWDGRAPGEREPHPITLPLEQDLGPDDCYVPAGWCWVGGDVEVDSLPRRKIWMDGFIVRRFPVTAEEYLEFMNGLVRSGREAEALAVCPRAQLGLSEVSQELAFERDGSGLFRLPQDRQGLKWRPDWPVTLVDWRSATEYARWLSARTGVPWRLLNELEREKAARGADGRRLPWGDHVEPTYACVVDSTPGEPSRESVHGHPTDESPYGVRGLAGNTRDWCINLWKHEGPKVENERLCLDEAEATNPDFRAVRGGAWSSALTLGVAAGRFGALPDARRPVVGIRVARSLKGGR